MRTVAPETGTSAMAKYSHPTVGCNYLSLQQIPASGTKVLNYSQQFENMLKSRFLDRPRTFLDGIYQYDFYW